MDRVILGLLVFFLALSVNDATTCYKCSTLTEGSKCGDDDFDESSVGTEECTATGACSKIKGPNSTTRGCEAIHLNEGCNTTDGVQVCVCKVDRCNDVDVDFFNTATNVASMTTMAIVVFANFAFRLM